jgi:hypothetical protein
MKSRTHIPVGWIFLQIVTGVILLYALIYIFLYTDSEKPLLEAIQLDSDLVTKSPAQVSLMLGAPFREEADHPWRFFWYTSTGRERVCKTSDLLILFYEDRCVKVSALDISNVRESANKLRSELIDN